LKVIFASALLVSGVLGFLIVGKGVLDIRGSNKSIDNIQKNLIRMNNSMGNDSTPSQSSQDDLMTREEFQQAVLGKTQQQVIQAVGRPDSTMNVGFPAWMYNHRTRDATTGNSDTVAQVLFQGGGVVTGVNFF
jgi:hypothetical protein